jgi:hypothetical protein
MTISCPIRGDARTARAISMGPALAQLSSFQWYRWKSLWKKSADSDQRPACLPREGLEARRSRAVQAIYYQHYTESWQVFGSFPPSNPASLSHAHLLHSSRAKDRLRVTRDGICRISNGPGFTPANPFFGFRIVPLTRFISRTILAGFTSEAAVERPRKFFRE